MRRIKSIFWLFLAWIVLFYTPVHGQTPPPLPDAIPILVSSIDLTQNVTVSVEQINELSITGDVNLVIDTVPFGGDPDDATDATSSTYSLTSNDAGKKIIGSLDANFSSGLQLFVLLGEPTGGSAAEQELTTLAIDLVTGIGYVAESALTITYRATATINAAPNGAGETRTVTLTLMDN